MTDQPKATGIGRTAGHTPTPWAVEHPYGEIGVYITAASPSHTNPLICAMRDQPTKAEMEANAAFIVRAANAHNALVETLGRIEARLRAFDPMTPAECERLWKVAIDALALARGEG